MMPFSLEIRAQPVVLSSNPSWYSKSPDLADAMTGIWAGRQEESKKGSSKQKVESWMDFMCGFYQS
jgi:hypothetical protein